MTEFPYSEAKLCDRIGIPIKPLRDRHLLVDLHWKKVRGEVALSSAGVKRLWRALAERPAAFDLADCLIDAPYKKNGAASEAIPLGDTFSPIPIVATVWRICPNPMVILAIDEHRARLSVWVGRNENYTIGMKIKIVPKLDKPGFWRMAGPGPQRRYTPDEWDRRMKAGFKG
ncbi:MAG: hypothetical protein ABI925_11325 [Verrucomicrobiota bacterium]